MKRNNLYLIVVLILVVGAIVYFESTKPKIDDSSINADIKIIGADEKAAMYESAKELVGPDGFINTDNISISEFIGKKVILVDFWTYSCINCQRTMPYLNTWYDKYKDDGLIIIGVHTPEFEFEKDYDNVVKATDKYGIKYPVVLDNDRQIWRAYNNRYWPRKYLIDIDGFIVYDHIGEGAYAETEKKIQDLLQERIQVLDIQTNVDSDIATFESDKGSGEGRTPEIYFGYKFSANKLGNEKGLIPNEVVEYTIPVSKKKDLFYLNGLWMNNLDNMELKSDEGSVYLKYFAKNINFVAGSESPTSLEVFIDGKKVNEMIIQDFDLYNLYSGEESKDHVLEIKVEKNIKLYSFTFG